MKQYRLKIKLGGTVFYSEAHSEPQPLVALSNHIQGAIAVEVRDTLFGSGRWMVY